MQAASTELTGGQIKRKRACRAYKGLDDEGGVTSPDRSQLVSPCYKRVLLKISGEALKGSHQFGIDPAVLQRISREVAEVSRSGVEVAIVVGGLFQTPCLHLCTTIRPQWLFHQNTSPPLVQLVSNSPLHMLSARCFLCEQICSRLSRMPMHGPWFLDHRTTSQI